MQSIQLQVGVKETEIPLGGLGRISESRFLVFKSLVYLLST